MGKLIRVWDGSAWQEVSAALPYNAVHSAQASMPSTAVDGQIWLDTDGTLSDTQYIPKTLTSTTGDIIYASSANTPARLGIGTSDQVLKVSGGVPVWGSAPAASYTWTSYTPTWTGLTTGNGTLQSCDYLQVGKIMFYRGVFIFGSTTSVTGSAFAPSLPAAMSMENRENVGQLRLHDSGTNTFAGFASIWSNALESNVVRVSGSYTDAPQTSATIPFTWTTNDQFIWFLTYKVA